MNINWILSTPTSNTALEDAEKTLNVIFPKEYSELVLKHNSAYPEPYCVFVNGKERIFESLLSINKTDSENIFEYSEIVSENCGKDLVAFGSDPFGNYWCFDYNNENEEPVIVYYDHESAFEYEDYEPQFVCNTFRELLESITESQEE